MNPTGLPHLSKQLRDQNNSQKPKINENQNFKKIRKILKTRFSRVPLFNVEFPYFPLWDPLLTGVDGYGHRVKNLCKALRSAIVHRLSRELAPGLIHSDWFICNFRFFGGSFRDGFGKVLTCCSDSCPSIFRPNFPPQIGKNHNVY